MRILLGTDGSQDAIRAADWLARFPVPPDSPILIVSVLPRLGPRAAEHEDALHAQAREVVENARSRLAPRPADVRLLEANVREGLLRAAEDWKADMIVLGARGLGGLELALLGSVSLGVAREARCAVMIVKGAAKELQRVVVGLDGSDDSRGALRLVTALPLAPDTEVLLVGVAEKIHFPRSAPGLVAEPLHAIIGEIEGEERARKEQILVAAENTIERKVRVQRRSVVGNPPDEIVAAARATDAQLIVLGSRGLGGIQRLVLGSVSEGVLLQSECTVLITRR
jgi:nucleotide-binding universal stress UspA family protein